VQLIIVMLVGLAFLFYVFPFAFVEAAKFQSGLTIKPPSTTEPEKICDDQMDNDNDGKVDANDPDCAAPATTTDPTATAGTCGLQIVSGVPINYVVNSGAFKSDEKIVNIKNEGTSQTPAKIMIKGGNWVSDAAPNPTISGPEVTRVAIAPVDFNNKKSLSSAGWELGQISGGQSIPIYFQMGIWVNAPSGSFHQDVTIDLLC